MTQVLGAVLGLEIMGHKLPSSGIAVIALLFVVGAFLVNRDSDSSAGGSGRTGRGRMYECKRCGNDFQSEQVELMASGDVRRIHDERCPKCGWELDWGSPDKPGGSGGGW